MNVSTVDNDDEDDDDDDDDYDDDSDDDNDDDDNDDNDNDDDVTDQIKTAGEIMDGLDSRLSLVTKAAAEFRTVTVIDVFSKNNAQNGELERINHTLSELMTETMELEMAVNTADVQNEANTNAIHDAEKTWAELKKNDTMQDGNLGILHVAVKDFKEKLLAVLANEFAFLDHHVEYAQFKLDTVKAKENARMCEVGSVTLTSEDRRAEYVFQSNFRTVPQIFYSITGFSKNLDAREDPKPHPPAASHYGYGYAPPPKPKEPNSLGVLVLVNPSQKALTVESFAGDFGDTEGISVDVTFQACTIGSGTNITDVHNFNLTTTTASTTDEMTSTTTATEFD
nr:hypothetical protein BaRGS_003165 [Batillaria attramentaria]